MSKRKYLVDVDKITYSREMTHLYHHISKKYYGGKLPNIEVYFGPLPAPKDQVKYGVTGIGKEKGKYTVEYIVLNQKLKQFGEDFSELILLHETIHAMFPHELDHGKIFKRERRRLILEGALDEIL